MQDIQIKDELEITVDLSSSSALVACAVCRCVLIYRLQACCISVRDV